MNKTFDAPNNFIQMDITIDKECKINYCLFRFPNFSFKEIINVTIKEGIIEARELFDKFLDEIYQILNHKENILYDFKCILYSGQNDYLVFIEFEEKILELMKKEKTKEIILKYFDIKE